MPTMELVPLIEVGNELGGGDLRFVVELADRYGAKVTEDWAGRPCVDAATAKKILEGYRAEVAEHDRLWAEYQGWLAAQDAERERVAAEAGAKARTEAHRKELAERQQLHEEGGGWAPEGFPVNPQRSPAVLNAGFAAAREARARWDKKHPQPDFETWKKKHR